VDRFLPKVSLSATSQVQLRSVPDCQVDESGRRNEPLIFSKKLNVTGVTIASPQVTLLQMRRRLELSSLCGAAAKAKQAQSGKSAGPRTPQTSHVTKLTLTTAASSSAPRIRRSAARTTHVNVTLRTFPSLKSFPSLSPRLAPEAAHSKLDGRLGPVIKRTSSPPLRPSST